MGSGIEIPSRRDEATPFASPHERWSEAARDEQPTVLTDAEERLVEGVLEVGEVIERDTFEFMIEEGLPAEELRVLGGDGTAEAAIEGLESRGLVTTERIEETVRDSSSIDDSLAIPGTEFERVERRYVRFTEELEAEFRE
ncbi:hypothetical protein [Halorubrum sodomense]|uniref:Uncharacterized protein n=1 Tax=Halorubrum sodomense TaxID=35743 RepID=A0A1I6GC72_HALSD|nr:hypothetical protein [Halorubrum sodomense]SFR39758.1 hypothetical protein SAMN04487937_1856 [Halorubrum sodomense]